MLDVGSAGDTPVLIPEWVDAETASDASGPGFVLPLSVTPLRPDQRIAGVAVTALAARDDNGVVRHVLGQQRSGGGDVLVVAGGSWSRHAIIGDLTAREVYEAGFRALITDGPVRDGEELKRLPLQVWCRGVTALAGHKERPGHTGIPVSIGGVTISPGDIIIASGGGVVVWPPERAPDFLTAARRKHEADTQRLAHLEQRGNGGAGQGRR